MKTIKKISVVFTILLCVLTSIFSLTACGKVAVENVVLDKSTATIKVEETLQLIGTVIPNDATKSTISWQSSTNSVATVSATGLVTGIGEGTCTITASAGGKFAVCVITVKKKAPDFKALYNALSNDYGWTLGSDGSYLSADTNVFDLDDYSASSILYEIKDMNKKIGLPDSLYNDMIQTTWSMGKQQETFENIGVKVSWTYHPDKGLEVTYKLIDA
ncbi:MAG: Ig domain-containing protein [Clostridia bacterium]|nr:Ig domain-containing protein [Clostridia bacterium]